MIVVAVLIEDGVSTVFGEPDCTNARGPTVASSPGVCCWTGVDVPLLGSTSPSLPMATPNHRDIRGPRALNEILLSSRAAAPLAPGSVTPAWALPGLPMGSPCPTVGPAWVF